VREEIARLGRRVLMIHGDVSDPEFCGRAVQQTIAAFGTLNVLVNNAAYQQRKASLDEITDEQWDRTFRTDEIAPAFVFFASEADSSYITGEVLTLLGGETRAA
jgi:NAD(P)-dependent dehydrogenase (short-subunit alcohol dehydrogenase family)